MTQLHTISQVRELNLDYDKKCRSCGHAEKVLCRVYGESMASHYEGWTDFTHKDARQQRRVEDQSAQDLSRKYGKFRRYQRCPKCGLYDQEDIEEIRQRYPHYVRARISRRAAGVITGIVVLLIPIGVFLFGQKEASKSNRDAWLLLLYILLSGLIIWLSLKKRTLSESEFVQRLNSDDVVAKWLKNWHGKNTKTHFYDLDEGDLQGRKERWDFISGSQHYLDYP